MKNKKIKTIGMVVAMEKEIIPFLETLGKRLTVKKRGDFEIFGYKAGGKKIYLIKSGIGEIYASSATQILISEYKADVILNFGVCGSLVKGIGVLDTVIVSGVVHYDFDLSAIDKVEVGQYPGYETPVIYTNEDYILALRKVMPDVKRVICASADKFVADEVIKKKLSGTFGAKVCDMESAGVLLTANSNGVPSIIIKAVSDGEGGAEEFERCVHQASRVYISAVKEIIKGI